MNLKIELEKFWKWANKSPEEYSKNRGSEEWELKYPYWENIYDSAEETIFLLSNSWNDEEACTLLEAIAIDNHSEFVRELCEDKLSINNIHLIKSGYKFYQSEARWQIAEIMRCVNIDINTRKKYLKEMLNDENEFVREKAFSVLQELVRNKPERITKHIYWRLIVHADNKKIANNLIENFKKNVDKTSVPTMELSIYDKFPDAYDISFNGDIKALNATELQLKCFNLCYSLSEGPWIFLNLSEKNEEFRFEAILNKEHKFENSIRWVHLNVKDNLTVYR
jgi:hypothetical protein